MSSDIKLLDDSIELEGQVVATNLKTFTIKGSGFMGSAETALFLYANHVNTDGLLSIDGESTGVIVDAGGRKRVGLMKYSGREAGIWRTNNQDFEIGRVDVTELPGKPTTFNTDLYIDGEGNTQISKLTAFVLKTLYIDGVSPFGSGLVINADDVFFNTNRITLDARKKEGEPQDPTTLNIALSHDLKNDRLVLNQEGRFGGGVSIEGNVDIQGSLSLGGLRTLYKRPVPDMNDYGLMIDGKAYKTGIVFISGSELRVSGATKLGGRLDVKGPIYQNGNPLHADYVFDPGYELESIQEHAKFMWKNKHLKSIQPVTTDESGLEVIEVGSHFRSILEELEKAHIYIDQLHKQNKALEERLALIEEKLGKID